VFHIILYIWYLRIDLVLHIIIKILQIKRVC
jgi:hypothetical protein